MSNQIANVPTALTLNTFTRTGYSFSGWNTAANGSGTAYADGATYSFAADITLYAQWTALPNHTVTFNSQRRDRLDEHPDRQRPNGLDAQHLHPDRLHVQRLEHGCQRLRHRLCQWRDLLLRGGHHPLRPVDGAAQPHRHLQQQRRDRHDEQPDRQRPNGPDAQHLHPHRLLVQRLEHGCQRLRHRLCQWRDLLLRGRHHPLRPVDGAAQPHRDLQHQRRHGHDEQPDRQRPDGPDGSTPSPAPATRSAAGTRLPTARAPPMPMARPTPSAADITLYAQWTALPNHTVTFNANGGTGTMSNQIANVPTALTAQHLHPDRLLVQRLEHGCQRLRHCLCQWRDLLLRGGHHPLRPVDGAAGPLRLPADDPAITAGINPYSPSISK